MLRRFRTAAAIRRAVVRVIAGAATAAIVVGCIEVRCAASVVSVAFVRDFDGGGWPTHREWKTIVNRVENPIQFL